MRTVTLAIGLAIAASNAVVAQAASHEHDMSQHQMAMPAASSEITHQSSGVLKAVNANENKVQIAHESIAELGWPAMTMWFTLSAPLPKNLKAGDTVRFEMLQGEKKQWVIVKIGRK
ncbi:MAG: copper-binding protein [Gallionella sp.]|nr:copper-binding protein [Gallionella sp.]